MTITYLDAAATAPLRPEARAAMLAVWDAGQANASSVHSAGYRARAAVDTARERLARALGARPGEIVFTSGGTEANTLAIVGLALARPRGRHLVTSAIEHSSVLESCRFLERVFGFELTIVTVDAQGQVAPEAVAAALRPDTTLLSIGLANAEVGTVQPIQAIADGAVSLGVPVHTDAVQAAASLPVSFASGLDAENAPAAWPGRGVTAMTVASHKFGGPQGVGALVLRAGTPIEPVLHGGGHEHGVRSGTENVAGIAGFAAAVVAATGGIGGAALDLMASRDALIRDVLAEVPGTSLTGHPEERLPGHASFTVAGVSGESLLVALDSAGLAVSSGSACAAGQSEPSPVLLAMGVAPELAQTALRCTLPAPLSESVRERCVEVLRAEVRKATGTRA
ncbi:cysteine desulfurase family protein [Leucobacter chromiireducens]|uniref:Cysteine desulfurase n=1 Tax=Leucobacter chromiireducens subsp. solipictus TaxID=398235 RepID=A0ABS1SGM0_9MICO|nr:cysteine desulfurase family protein [Leucobacter chromiireducens]MBL3679187.1 cysteine desulfurase [Leucobacter chromiireducens subsp. solipictus]